MLHFSFLSVLHSEQSWKNPQGVDTNPLGRAGLTLAATDHIASFGGTAERVVRPARVWSLIELELHDKNVYNF